MACAGVIASAGAQLDFSTLTIAGYTVGKATSSGFRSVSGGSSSMSNPTLEFGSGTVFTCTALEDQGSTISFQLSSLPSSKPSVADSFKRIIIGDLTLNQADTSSYSNSTGFNWTTSDDVFSGSIGSTINVELRAD